MNKQPTQARRLFVALACTLAACTAPESGQNSGTELSDADAGMYYAKGGSGPLYFTLSKAEGKWALKDKNSGELVSPDLCYWRCDYRAATETEIGKLFAKRDTPPDNWSCIRNPSFAFCRNTAKPDRSDYVLFAYFSDPPRQIPVWRAE